jgi:hypothetical protein
MPQASQHTPYSRQSVLLTSFSRCQQSINCSCTEGMQTVTLVTIFSTTPTQHAHLNSSSRSRITYTCHTEHHGIQTVVASLSNTKEIKDSAINTNRYTVHSTRDSPYSVCTFPSTCHHEPLPPTVLQLWNKCRCVQRSSMGGVMSLPTSKP